MDPEPLVGILADDALEYRMKSRRIRLQVAGNSDGRKEAEDVFLFRLRPKCKTRDDGRAGVGSQLHKARSGAGWDAEEIHKDAVLERSILIDEDAHGLIGGQSFQNAAREIFFLDEPVAGKSPVPLHHAVDERIV